MTPTKVARLIPRRARLAIYSVLAALYGLELIWDFLDSNIESKLVASASVLGFGLAAANTTKGPSR